MASLIPSAPARTNPKIRECGAADTYPDQSMQHIAMTATDLGIEAVLASMNTPCGNIRSRTDPHWRLALLSEIRVVAGEK